MIAVAVLIAVSVLYKVVVLANRPTRTPCESRRR